MDEAGDMTKQKPQNIGGYVYQFPLETRQTLNALLTCLRQFQRRKKDRNGAFPHILITGFCSLLMRLKII